DRDDVRVVVLAPEARGLEVPRERGAHARDLVRRDLLAVAGAADDDAERARLRGDRLARGEAERRVVVLGVVRVGAVVHDVVARGTEVLHEVGLELEAGVVRGDVNAHAPIMPQRAPWTSGRGRSLRRMTQTSPTSTPAP